jgi:ABC-type polysaccharide/polyol phosphate export permease
MQSDAQAAVAVGSPHLRGLESPVERIVVPTKRRLKLRDIFGEAAVIRVLATRDFKVKYKQSMLGPVWLVFQPVALLVGFVIAFRGLGDVKTSGVPYAVFALCGLTVWAFFQAAMTIGTASVITNSSFVRYTPCPRPAFPIAAIIASLPSFAITSFGAVVTAAVSGALSPRVVLLPLGLLWLLVLTTGAVGITASLAVRYRDMISAMPFFLQVAVFLAPIGYSLDGLSKTVRTIVELNPVTGILEAVRWMMLSGYHPRVFPIVVSLVLTAITAVVGWRTFAARETTMADEI